MMTIPPGTSILLNPRLRKLYDELSGRLQMASRVFTAAYRGMCEECGNEIEPGEDVQYVDDVLVHEDCNPEI